MEKSILEELVEFAIGISYGEIPTPVIHQANRCLFDLIGCFYGGLSVEQNRTLLAHARQTNPKPEAALWGTGQKAGMGESAFAHGCIAHHLEYDDGISMGAHWGSETIPAILAMAESKGHTGADILAAIVLAYEAGNRISHAFSSEMLAHGIHFPCAMGVFGAIIGVARLAGLSKAETVGAMGNACLTPIAPYIPATSGDPIKDAYAGWPNTLAISLSRLSRAGWGGPRDLLEGQDGLARVLGWNGSSQALHKRILTGLGTRFEIMKTYFKPYPCCRWLHAPVRAILDMKSERGWAGDEIVSIRIEGPGFLRLYDKKEGFDREIAARFSLPYVAAAAALHGHLGLEEFEPHRRTDPSIADLAQRVFVTTDPVFERSFPHRFHTRVWVQSKGGITWEKECGLPWGPDNPPTDEELEAKFRYLTGRLLKSSHVEKWVSLFAEGLETEGSSNTLMRLLHLKINRQCTQ